MIGSTCPAWIQALTRGALGLALAGTFVPAPAALLTDEEKAAVALAEFTSLNASLVTQQLGLSLAELPFTGGFSASAWSSSPSGSYAGAALAITTTASFDTAAGTGSLSTTATVGGATWTGTGSYSFSTLGPDTNGLLLDYVVNVQEPGKADRAFDREIVEPKLEVTTDNGTTRHTVSQGKYFWTLFDVRIKQVEQRNDIIGPSQKNGPVVVSVTVPEDGLALTGIADFMAAGGATLSGVVSVVPEPASGLLWAGGVVVLAAWAARRRRRHGRRDAGDEPHGLSASERPDARGRAWLLLLPAVILASLASPAQGQSQWVLDVSGVWDGPGNRKLQWNPAAGQIGNMGNAGVSFHIGAAPAGAQAGAAAAAAAGFQPWHRLGQIPTVRINFAAQAAAAGAKLPVTWGVTAFPGEATGAAPGYNPDPIVLNQARTLRTDGWSIDRAGTRPALIDEYDVYTTMVHEVGHPLGLGHPGSMQQVMTDQTTARGNAASNWRFVEKPTPFVGQPLLLGGGAQPAGALDYKDPRAKLSFGDALGAITLYSAPVALITSAFNPRAGRADGGGDYTYRVDNVSAHGTLDGEALRAGYDTRTVTIPVDASIVVSDLVASAGWSLTRTADAVVATSQSSGLLPGEDLEFSFFAPAPPTDALPSVGWSIEGLGACAAASDDDRGCASPGFDPANFGVLDGTYTYRFDMAGDRWEVLPHDLVLTPVPEPEVLWLLAVGLLVLGAAHRQRRASPEPAQALR